VPVDLVAVDRDIPFHARIGAFGQLSRILPQQIARGGIQSLDLVTESVHQHHTIVDQGCGLIGAGRQRPRPRDAQVVYIRLVICLRGLKP
jgi:hypothetical protein